MKDFADLLKLYGISSINGDRYAGEWVREPFAKANIQYKVSERSKSDLYQAFLPLLTSGRVDCSTIRN